MDRVALRPDIDRIAAAGLAGYAESSRFCTDRPLNQELLPESA